LDSIVYSGARDANIDLRSASLQYEVGGGGWVSYATGIFGGFTIANRVTIEIAVSGSGNDTLIGNDTTNILNGGAGTDDMSGLGGHDIYYVDNIGDQVHEAVGGGWDLVYSTVSYALISDSQVEGLSTSDHSAVTSNYMIGNAIDNRLWGDAGNNALDGRGGVDLMIGWGGNDTYYVDNVSDEVHEVAGGGSDTIYTSVSYALGFDAHSEMEKLSTIDHSATTAINLTGNDTGQFIYGNAGNNVLDGKGGNDTLIAWGGADTFAFTSALGAGNVDTVHSFQSGTDKIALDDAVFTGLGLGALGAGAFATGGAAADADDRIIYNSSTGALLFDADGNGAGAAVQFATLLGAPSLAASDFLVI